MNNYEDLGKTILALSNLLIEESVENSDTADVIIEIGAKIGEQKIKVTIERTEIE